jgi:predicted metal-dependent phosphoesterase TrpH
MLADLHVHTTASDGTDSPEEVVAKAAEAGLAALAVADHDTLGGVREAERAGARHGVEVLPAIELSTELGDREIHILGYLLDPDDKVLQGHLEFFRQSRRQRAAKMVEKLRRMGFDINYKNILEIAGDGSVGRPHIARALIDAGVVASLEEAFEKYIGSGRPAFEPRFKYSPLEAVRIIRNSGGIAVFAHPGMAGCDLLIPGLAEAGLQGLEVYHPAHNTAASDHYRRLCRQYNLLATGGSDYHGSSHREHKQLGSAVVDYQVVREMKNIARGSV